MNVNLHIDSIVLDGLDLAPGQSQLLQQAVASQLTTMLTQLGLGSPLADSSNRPNIRGNSIHLGQTTDAKSLGPQLAHAIYASIPQSEVGSVATHGGQP